MWIIHVGKFAVVNNRAVTVDTCRKQYRYVTEWYISIVVEGIFFVVAYCNTKRAFLSLAQHSKTTEELSHKTTSDLDYAICNDHLIRRYFHELSI